MRGAAGPGRLRHRVGEYIAQNALWSTGQTVAVACSGGMDSVVLLDVLAQTRAWHGGVLSVVTINHGTRQEGPSDADFVTKLATDLGLDCVRADFELGEHASEAVCREARREVFDGLDADVVALAHHRDDQAETVLLRMISGTSSRGLAAMRPRRDRIVRPFLTEERQALVAWAAFRGLSWREDPSNRDPRFTRNRLRHEVLPLLEEIRPGASRALARLAGIASAEEDVLANLAAQAPQPQTNPLRWTLAWVRHTPDPILFRALVPHLPSLTHGQIQEIRRLIRGETGPLSLPNGVVLKVRDRELVCLIQP